MILLFGFGIGRLVLVVGGWRELLFVLLELFVCLVLDLI